MSAPTIPDWINAVAAGAGAIAVIVGLFAAKSTISENRKAAKDLRRSQVAEQLIAVALNADDALKEMRNPISTLPKDKVGDKTYYYKKRYSLVTKYNELFRALRDAQIRVRAVIGDEEVDDAVETLFVQDPE